LLNHLSSGEPQAGSIVYNFEQVCPESSWTNGAYLALLKSHKVWDDSERNLALLKSLDVSDIQYVPLGWMLELSRSPPAVPDIDILFCGSINDRRLRILNELKARNVHAEQTFGLYGKQRELAPPKAQLCALERDPPSQCRPCAEPGHKTDVLDHLVLSRVGGDGR
jgi:hypothetical protein